MMMAAIVEPLNRCCTPKTKSDDPFAWHSTQCGPFLHFSIWPLSSAPVNNKGSLKSAHRDKPTVYEATPAINAIKIIDRAKHLSAAKWRGVRHFNAPEPFCSLKSMLIK